MTYNQMMRKIELNENFSFTGMYERAYDTDAVKEMKARAKVEYKGYKTRVVREDDGVSIYVEKRYEQDQIKAKLQRKIDSYEQRREYAYKKYLDEIERLEAEQNETIKELQSL